MNPLERLLKYTVIRTPSDEHSSTVPSSKCQFELAWQLHRELFTMGITDVTVDTNCYLYAHIPATPGYEDRPKLGFIAIWTLYRISATSALFLLSTKIMTDGICPSVRADASFLRKCSLI